MSSAAAAIATRTFEVAPGSYATKRIVYCNPVFHNSQLPGPSLPCVHAVA